MVDGTLFVEGQDMLRVYYGTLLWHTCPFYLLICFETDYYQLEWGYDPVRQSAHGEQRRSGAA